MMPKQRDGAGGRARHAHAAVQRPHPEAAGADRRQIADRLRARPARRRRRRTRGGQRASPRRRARAASRAAHSARSIVISDERGTLLGTGGGIAKALPQLGDAPFFLVNSDTIWLDGVKPNFARLADAFDPADDGCAAAARADRRQHRLCRARRFRHAARRPLAAARARTRWCPSSMPARRCSLRRCSPMRRAAPFRSRCCSTAPATNGPPVRAAARRRLDARRHARRGRRRGSALAAAR